MRTRWLEWLLRLWRRLPAPLQFVYLRLRYGRFGIGVAALIRDERGKVLVVHRTYSRDEPWALPGGWLEGPEGVERTLERELMEETGLRVRAGPVAAMERTGFALVVLLHADLVDGVGGFRASPEVSEVAWVEPSDVGRLSPVNARLIRRALA
ncbi:MAG: NUDIX hydrolase [Chloroflexi bacterium]|nr:NUDIX hydrolase [Chloroflexota bacterium]MBV9544885.1 NUDIX hydrolase [Chloroflexota bacterium]